jgi:hypothetical protein
MPALDAGIHVFLYTADHDGLTVPAENRGVL